MSKQLKVSFHFLESNKSVLGLEYSQGTVSFPGEKPENYDELIIGFLFFYISIMYTTEKGDS